MKCSETNDETRGGGHERELSLAGR
jgi:hypothetical protein